MEKTEKATITVSRAAKILGMNPMAVRLGMRDGSMDIGYCRRNAAGTGWRYYVYPDKLNKFLGR